MDYKTEIEKMGWSIEEVDKRIKSLIEQNIIDVKVGIYEDLATTIELKKDNVILNQFFNKKV